MKYEQTILIRFKMMKGLTIPCSRIKIKLLQFHMVVTFLNI